MVIKINKSKFNPLYIYILMLIFFGLTFTKTQIFGPLYLHDLVLIIFLVYSITVRPLKTLKFPTILVFIFIKGKNTIQEIWNFFHNSVYYVFYDVYAG